MIVKSLELPYSCPPKIHIVSYSYFQLCFTVIVSLFRGFNAILANYKLLLYVCIVTKNRVSILDSVSYCSFHNVSMEILISVDIWYQWKYNSCIDVGLCVGWHIVSQLMYQYDRGICNCLQVDYISRLNQQINAKEKHSK